MKTSTNTCRRIPVGCSIIALVVLALLWLGCTPQAAVAAPVAPPLPSTHDPLPDAPNSTGPQTVGPVTLNPPGDSIAADPLAGNPGSGTPGPVSSGGGQAAIVRTADALGGAPAPGEKVVYLTFDDGPSGYTQAILDLLARYNAKATFFVLGQHAAGNLPLLQEMDAAGHGIANHTYDHPYLTSLNKARFTSEVTGTAQVLGAYDHRCLRPPYGAQNATVRSYAAALGYTLILWSVDPRDWSRPGAGAIANRVLSRVGPNSIVLFHDGGGDRSQTVAALEKILQSLSAQGYKFAPLCRDGAPSLPAPILAQAPAAPAAPAAPTPAAPALAAPAAATPAGAQPFTATINKPAAAAQPASQPPAQSPTQPAASGNGLFGPKASSTVKGMVAVRGVANRPDFRKWQLDVLLNGTDETFLAYGETPVPAVSDLLTWDTTKYPNGKHILRLRVVYDTMNYDEYFLPVTVSN